MRISPSLKYLIDCTTTNHPLVVKEFSGHDPHALKEISDPTNWELEVAASTKEFLRDYDVPATLPVDTTRVYMYICDSESVIASAYVCKLKDGTFVLLDIESD